MNGLESLFDDLEVENPCTIICEAYNEYRGVGVYYDRALSSAQILSNQIIREYNLNCKQAKVRCLKESGTMDDYAFYEAAAEQGAIGKLRGIIEAIIRFFKNLCEKARIAINTKICSAKAKDAVKKMEKKIKLNPQLAAEKVNVPDHSAMIGLLSRQKTRLDTYDAQLIAGFTGPMKPKTLLDTISEFNASVGNIVVGGALTYAITLGALIVDLKSEMDRLPAYLTTLESSQSKILKRLIELIDDDTAASAAMAAVQQTANFRVQLNKQELDVRLQSVYDKIKVIEDALQRHKGKYPVNVNVMEDGDEFEPYGMDIPMFEDGDDESYFDHPFFEGVNSDITATYKEFTREASSFIKAGKTAYKDGEYATARSQLRQANDSIDRGIAAINKIDKSDTGSAVIGIGIGSISIIAKAILAAIPTFGLGAYIVGINETLKNQKEIAEAQNNHNLDVGDYNLYRNQQKASLRRLKKVVDVMIAKVDSAAKGQGKESATGKQSISSSKSSVKNESWDDLGAGDSFFEDASESEIEGYLEALFNTVI